MIWISPGMKEPKNFTEHEVFNKLVAGLARADGAEYRDVATIYGDMSRLVVGWLARTPPAELRRLYNDLGWGGSANVRAIHEVAKAWYEKYDKRKLPLKEAYEFARDNELGEEAQRIKGSPARLRSYTSSIRRGMIIDLFEKRGLFDRFKAERWPFGNTKAGQTVTKHYLDLKREFDQTKQQ